MGFFKDSGKRAKRKAAGKAKMSSNKARQARSHRKRAKNRRQGRWPS